MPMTFEDFERACAVTGALLLAAYPGMVAERNEGAEWTPTHLLWMLTQALIFHAAGKAEKAHRWLGFVQGVSVALGIATVEALKLANMPKGETFEEGRV